MASPGGRGDSAAKEDTHAPGLLRHGVPRNDCVGASPTGTWLGETYYDQPTIKAVHWGWKISWYLFTSALGGGAQLIAAIAQRAGGTRMRHVVRSARYIAFAGSVIGPALVMRDLKTPGRWYNMLRIFRRTSPMSVGSFNLCAFALFGVATALEERLSAEAGTNAHAQVPAAIAGIGQMTYTAPLLAATSTPLWAAAPELLAARYGSSAIALAAASLSLIERLSGRTHSARALDQLALVATGANALLSRAARKRYAATGVDRVYAEPVLGGVHRSANALAIGLPLACGVLSLLLPRRARVLSMIASGGIVAGTALSRWSDITAGDRSAERADVYLRFTQPDIAASARERR